MRSYERLIAVVFAFGLLLAGAFSANAQGYDAALAGFTKDSFNDTDSAISAVAASGNPLALDVIQALNTPVVARAGSGVCYAYFDRAESAAEAVERTHNAIIEFAPEDRKPKLNLWPTPGPDFELMKRIKDMFDPEHLLNRGRLYRQL